MLAACGLFLWMQKDVRLSASLSFLITAGLIVFFFPRQLGLTEGTAFTAGLVFRLRCVRDEMLTGAMLFSAVFLLNEPYTCAHHRLGRILYGVMVGAFTMGFRYFGVYETGVCFAILAVNSISGWLDRTEVRSMTDKERQMLQREEDRKGGCGMKRHAAELLTRDPERFFHHDRVFLNNPVVMQGMGLAPLVVLATSGQNALMLAVAVALLLTPSRMLACLLSRLFPLREEHPANAELEKKLLPRSILYSGSAAVVYLAAYPILNRLFGVSLLVLGIYLPCWWWSRC